MFRSLFIGFLILSALTSKGAAIQINQEYAKIAADFLLEFLNRSSLYTDKQLAQPADADSKALNSGVSGISKTPGIDKSCIRACGSRIENINGIKGIKRRSICCSNVLLAGSPATYISGNIIYIKGSNRAECIRIPDIYFFSSDASPPDFR